MNRLIYLADDEENIRNLMKAFLENEGYAVRTFADGAELRAAFAKQAPDLIILDIMMPGEDGLSVCSYIRRRSKVPIVFVSAKDTALDRVNGIMLGGDDYITKPFLPLELIARIRAIFRRIEAFSQEAPAHGDAFTTAETGLSSSAASLPAPYLCGNLRLEPGTHKVFVGSAPLSVTPTEYKFLLYLLERKQTAVAKEELLQAVWKYDDPADSRMSDDLLKRLRKKLREASCTAVIETIWGYGYNLHESAEAAL